MNETRQVRISGGTPEQLVSQVLEKHRAAALYKLGMAGDWMLNLAFYLNKQNVVYDRGQMALRESKDPRYREMQSENRIAPTTMSVVQLMNSINPDMELVPVGSGETEDGQAALVSEAVSRYVKKVTDWRRKISDMNWWRGLLGTSFVRYWIDPAGGKKRQFGVMNPDTGMKDVVEFQDGEIRSEVFSAWDVSLFPVTAPTMRQVVAVMFSTFMPVEDAKEKWPEIADKIEAGDDNDAYEFYKKRVEWLNAPMGLSLNQKGSEGLVRVYEYLEVPCAKYPKGRKIVVVNNQLAEDVANPFADLFTSEVPNYLKLGLVAFRCFPVPGRVWGRGVPEDLRPMQMELNEVNLDLKRHRRANLRARVFLPDGGGVDQITNKIDGVYKYKPLPGTPAATVIPPIQLGNAPFLMREALIGGINEVGQRPNIARGTNDSQVRSGQQATLLLEQANQPFGAIAWETAEGYADCTRLEMALAMRYYSPLKVMEIVGQQKGYAINVMKRINLYTDVAIVPGTETPKNRGAWNSMLSQMLPLLAASGGPNAQRYVTAVIEQLDMGGVKFEKPEQADIDRQDTELEILALGQWVAPEVYDDHLLHADRCDVYLKKHPNLSPMARKLIEVHQQAHRVMLARMVMPPLGAMAGNAEGGTDETLRGAAASDEKRQQQMLAAQTQHEGAVA